MTGSGDGVHVLTGPIYVEGAEPGDVLKVEILELYPRQNPQCESYGVNVRLVFSHCHVCIALSLYTKSYNIILSHDFSCVAGGNMVGVSLWN